MHINFLVSHFSPMKANVSDVPIGKNTTHNTHKRACLLVLTLTLLTIVPLYLLNSSPLPFQFPNINTNGSKSIEFGNQCNMFSGNWVPAPNMPYYTNETCNLIIPQQNCLAYGRPDTAFMKWRWKPDECELPLFDAVEFLELVRGKSIGFLGDSVGRNQMQSLLCLLASVVYPVDISLQYATDTTYFKRYIYTDYNITLATFWAPFLVKASESEPNGHSYTSLMNLYLDEPDDPWRTQIEEFDYVVISAGQWFSRPMIFYENGQIVGCHDCNKRNITSLSKYYGFKMAFHTAFRTLMNLKNYKGVTFLRTYSPQHFENGQWNNGGNCPRTRPIKKGDRKLDGYQLEYYLTQLEEYRAAEREARKRGLKFKLLDTTNAMVLRPDGHPNYYGRRPNKTIADCVHWCVPGPIDTWNEFLLQMLRMEHRRPIYEKLLKHAG